MTKEYNLESIQTEFRELLANLKTTNLATIDESNHPEASYTPYVEFESAYYLFISDLAKHTINLKQNPSISLLFIEDEASCRNQFSRRRAILQGKGTIVQRDSAHYQLVMAQFRDKFGGFIDLIEPLLDFNLFQINAHKGRYIRGFAQAFELTGDGLNQIEHIGPKSP
ncbi:MAG: putative heme iron utilization protein [Polaribacter sp.]